MLLPELTDGCIVTTNFDEVLERLFLKKNRPFEGYMHGIQSENQFASKLIQGERCLLKLHGNHNSPDTFIFSKVQYDEAYGKNVIDYTKTLSKVLRQIFTSHSLLFLGCSLEQDRTMELFQDVVKSNSFDIPNHFALLPEINDIKKRIEKEDFLSLAKIHPIWYPLKATDSGKSDHMMLEQLISFSIDCSEGKVRI